MVTATLAPAGRLRAHHALSRGARGRPTSVVLTGNSAFVATITGRALRIAGVERS